MPKTSGPPGLAEASVSSQIVGIDILRFLAAMTVAIYHLTYIEWADPSGRGSAHATLFLTFRSWAPFVGTGWVGVPIFFVISGFVIAYTANGRSPIAFVTGRALRLVPGVWICASASVFALLLAGMSSAEVAKAYLLSLVFFPTGPWVASSYWTLPVEIIFYALVFGLLARNRFDRIGTLAVALGGSSLFLWLWIFLFPFAHAGADPFASLIRHRFAPLLLAPHGCFFAIGIMMWLVTARRRSIGHTVLVFAFVTAGVTEIYHETARAAAWSGVPANPLVPIFVFCASVAMIAASIRWNNSVHRLVGRRAACIRTVGLMTYPLYLLHQPFGVLLTAWWLRRGIPAPLALMLAISVVLAMSLIVVTKLEPLLRRRIRPILDAATAHVDRRVPWIGRQTEAISCI